MKAELFAMTIVLILLWLLISTWAYYAPPTGRFGSFVIISALSGPVWIPFVLFFYQRYLEKNWDRE